MTAAQRERRSHAVATFVTHFLALCIGAAGSLLAQAVLS